MRPGARARVRGYARRRGRGEPYGLDPPPTPKKFCGVGRETAWPLVREKKSPIEVLGRPWR